MAISRSDMERQLRKDGGILTLEDAKRMAPPGESLAYINPDEAALLKSLGGAGEDINGTGIKSYFLKKIFRKAKKAVKKVVKSPIGKAAILGGLTFGIPGTQFSGLAGGKGLGSFFGKGSFNPLKSIIEKKGFGALTRPSGFAKLLGKAGLGGKLGSFAVALALLIKEDKELSDKQKLIESAVIKYLKETNQYDEILNNEGDIFEANISDKPINTCFGIDVYEVDGELLSEQEYAKTL